VEARRSCLRFSLVLITLLWLAGSWVLADNPGPTPTPDLIDTLLLDISYLWLFCGVVTFALLLVVLVTLVLRRGRRRPR